MTRPTDPRIKLIKASEATLNFILRVPSPSLLSHGIGFDIPEPRSGLYLELHGLKAKACAAALCLLLQLVCAAQTSCSLSTYPAASDSRTFNR